MAHALRNDTIEILGDLIAFPSISQQSNLELIAYLNGRLDQIGARTFLTLASILSLVSILIMRETRHIDLAKL